MITLKALIKVCMLIAFVNAHGGLYSPAPRIPFDYAWQQLSGEVPNTYYYRGGQVHICGSNGDVDSQLTGTVPTKSVYLSGSTVNMTAHILAPHPGWMSVKLCKLNSPTDIATQSCFDQNIIKIKGNSGQDITPSLDDYNLRTGNPGCPNYYNFTAQLPAGLTCDNCVILWEWIVIDGIQFLNGTGFDNSQFVSSIGAMPGPGQNRRSCADIKILPNPSAAAVEYKPNPAESIYKYHDFPQVFYCWEAPVFGLGTVINKRPDPNLYTGDILRCFPSTANTGLTCEYCRQVCGFKGKTCPDTCFCRWINRPAKTYLKPMKNDDWWNRPEVDEVGSIQWRVDGSALGCDLPGLYIDTAKAPSTECASLCKANSACTSWTWSLYINGGTCFFKSNNYAQSDAVLVYDTNLVCGIVKQSNAPQLPNPDVKCDGQRYNISCTGGKTISIVSADYGRWDKINCKAPWDNNPNWTDSIYANYNCHSLKSTTSILDGVCSGQTSCEGIALPGLLTDPCWGVFKQLQINYKCI